MGEPSDPDLLRRAQTGDRDALGHLLENCRPYLSILAARRLDPLIRPRLGGSDIVQQTCLEVLRDFASFRGQSIEEFAMWLNRILAHNVDEAMQVHVVAQKRSVQREQTRGDSDGPDAGNLIATNLSSPSSRAMRGERAIQLARTMAKLPDDQFQAVRLRHIEGLPLAEIAQLMERTEAAVASLIKRGLQGLREGLREAGDETRV
jgi:RNA polymerase sigma-70 factor, ECF subfamily